MKRNGWVVLALVASGLMEAGCGVAEDVERTEADGELGTASAAAATMCGRLNPGQFLKPGEELASCNGRKSWLAHQGDGNVVVYDLHGDVWNSGTYGVASKLLVMQTDGNLVLYDQNNVPRWYSQTSGNPNAYLALQDNCELVVYSAANQRLWGSGKLCHFPPAPSNPSAWAESTSTIRINWTDNSSGQYNETEFRVKDELGEVRTVPRDQTTFVWTGLAPGTTKRFRVRAHNLMGNSDWTPEVVATTWDIPAAPSNLNVLPNSSSCLWVSWTDNSSNEQGFFIANDRGQYAFQAANTPWYFACGLPANSWTCFTVQAYNQAGYSAPTPQVCGLTFSS